MGARLREVLADETMRRLLVAYVAINVLDLVTTYAVLQAGGFERNPLLSFFFARYPYLVGAALKLLLSTVVAAYILWNATWSESWRRAARWEMAFAILLLVLVVLNNFIAYGAQTSA